MADLPSDLRVLHVGKYFWLRRGGVENAVYHLCCRLKDHVDLRVLVSNTGPELVREVYDGIRVTRLPLARVIAGMPISPGLIRELARAEADIIHFHIPNPMAELACLLARPRGAVISLYHHDVQPLKVLWPAYRMVDRAFLARNRRIIATAPQNIEFSPVLRAFRDRARVIPLAIEPADFARTPERVRRAAELRAEWGGGPIIFFVGRHVWSKGIHVLIRAMKQVDAQLVVGGDGPRTEWLRRFAAESAVASRVRFIGNVRGDELAAHYMASDIFCLPSVSRLEAFGIVQLEAMACEVPVVSTRLTTGVVYANLDGVSGLTAEPNDSGALAAALRRLVGDEELRRRLGAQARERVMREFTYDVTAQKTLDLYAEVAAERGLTGPRAKAAVPAARAEAAPKSAGESPLVVTVVLNWNGLALSRECLASLRQVRYPRHRVLLVDNGSRDGSVLALRAEFPEAEFIENPVNLGFAEGNNVGIRRALATGADWVLVLNNDTTVDPGFLARLVESAAADPSIGVIGPKIDLYYDPSRLSFAGGRVSLSWGFTWHVGNGHKDSAEFGGVLGEDYQTGAALMISRACLERVGAFDPSYVSYFEDTDLCLRARAAGFRVVCDRDAVIRHKVSASTGGGLTPRKAYRKIISGGRFFRRWSGRARYYTTVAAFNGGYALATAVALCAVGRFSVAGAIVRGFADLLRGRDRDRVRPSH